MSKILNDNLAHVMNKIRKLVNIKLYLYNTRFIARSISGCSSQALSFFYLPAFDFTVEYWIERRKLSSLDILGENMHICWQLKRRWKNTIKLFNEWDEWVQMRRFTFGSRLDLEQVGVNETLYLRFRDRIYEWPNEQVGVMNEMIYVHLVNSIRWTLLF